MMDATPTEFMSLSDAQVIRDMFKADEPTTIHLNSVVIGWMKEGTPPRPMAVLLDGAKSEYLVGLTIPQAL